MINKYKLINKGQSLIELIFAIGIAALVISAIIALTSTSVKTSTGSRNNEEATKYVQEAIEYLRVTRDQTDGWDTLASSASTSGTINYLCTYSSGDIIFESTSSNCPITNTNFTRYVTLKILDDPASPTLIEAKVKVTWPEGDASGTAVTKEVESTTRFSRWQR